MKQLFTISDEIKEKLLQNPGNTLAIGRTVLANERTLLSFVRTAVGQLAGGIGLIAYLKHPVIVGAGWMKHRCIRAAAGVGIPAIIAGPGHDDRVNPCKSGRVILRSWEHPWFIATSKTWFSEPGQRESAMP